MTQNCILNGGSSDAATNSFTQTSSEGEPESNLTFPEVDLEWQFIPKSVHLELGQEDFFKYQNEFLLNTNVI